MNDASTRAPRPVAAELVRASLLSGLDPAVLASVAREMTVMAVAPGQIVVAQGERTDDVYFVLSGQLLGLLLSDGGKEIGFTRIGAGRYFGEIAALDGRPRSITVSAAEDCRLGVMRAQTLLDLMRDQPVVAVNLARDLADRNRMLTERIFGLVVHDVDKRVRVQLSRLAQQSGQLKAGGVLNPAPSHDEIATFVGANREAVSRVLARLASEGIIETGRRRIGFNDIEALVAGL